MKNDRSVVQVKTTNFRTAEPKSIHTSVLTNSITEANYVIINQFISIYDNA